MKKITSLFKVLVFNSFVIIAILISFQVHAQVVSTFVGAGTPGKPKGTGTPASFNGTVGLSIDASGNIYVADRENHLIRKITPAGVVSTFAGSGSSGSANGTGTSASFSKPHDIAIDQSGNVYVADYDNHLIRKITSAGVVSTFAGSGSAGSANGTGTSASFNDPSGIAIGPNGNIYVTDKGNNLIRKITSAGVVSTFAGSGSAGSANGTGTSASFNNPRDIDFDASGNIYVCDKTNHLIRKITSAGVVSTYAGSGSSGSTNGTGTSASFNTPAGLVFDADDNLYISDYHNFLIRKILPQTQLGNDIDGETAGDEFGGSVSVSKNGKYMVVGAMYNDGNGSNSGHVRVYEYSSGSWSQLGSDIDGEAANDQSGKSVSLSSDGTKVAIGAIRNDGNGNDAGHVRVYQYSSGSWSQLGSDIDGEAAGDYFGAAVSLSDDGTILAVGAIYNDGTGTNAGQARIYKYSGSSWSQLGADIDGEAAGDFFGKAVSLSGDGTKLGIGANRNSGNGTYAGSIRTYNISASLPVDLTYFDAHAMDDHRASLHWATASEINNSHFEIERSYDARTFESVGEVSGNGNSQHLIEYSYLDEGISLLKNTVFYRLKQVDFDGAFEYSDIRVVRFDELERGIHFYAYPNPMTNELSVMVSLSKGEAYQIEVTDLHGAKVHYENHTFTNGIHKLNTSEWNSGMYILQVATDKGSKYVKVMKE